MTEIPASLIAFQRLFPDDDACARWLVAVRWPNGFRCPACGHDRGRQLKTRPHSFECARCHRQASVIAGTLLHRTRLSLATWFRAAYLMATHCNGISALQLQKRLGIGSCRSAWMLAVKLRRAMETPERSPLSGLVGIDEACLPQCDKRLQTCLDEFVFRFNRRRNRYAAFLSLFLQALCAKPRPFCILIKPEPSA